MTTGPTPDEEIPLGDHWRRNRLRRAEPGSQPYEEHASADPRREPARRNGEDNPPKRVQDADRELEETTRDASASVDLYALDAMYAQSAANGMADSTGKALAVETAVAEAAQRRSGGTRPPTRSDRARAAQRWEQNREYVESRHENRDRKQ